MTSIYTILLLILFGLILTPTIMILFPFSGVIGEIVGGEPGKRSKLRLRLGVLVAAVGQIYFYLSYLAFIISWTTLRITSDGFSKYLIWIVAFFSSLVSLWWGLTKIRVQHKSKNTGFASITVEASYLCGIFSFISFFIFLFYPKSMTLLWNWVPYVGK